MPFPQIGQAPIEDKWLAEMKGCGTIRQGVSHPKWKQKRGLNREE
ncbi:hypothetical protein ABS751_21915 [Bacillus subtilis]|nr:MULTISPECIES: hypothetical protein [Bacillus subtilis group]MEC1896664.1 hypothetical protein [Bacillus velezensis]MEC1916972.1 hypothetical protein [Bacillus velezensis]MEC3797937.1 hypothetical protein [Bacillus velezensis]